MKSKHIMLIVVLVLVVLMIHKPKRTTAQITSGEQGAINLASASLGGFFTAPSSKKGG